MHRATDKKNPYQWKWCTPEGGRVGRHWVPCRPLTEGPQLVLELPVPGRQVRQPSFLKLDSQKLDLFWKMERDSKDFDFQVQ